MLFLSSLLNARIRDNEGRLCGTVEDIIIDVGSEHEFPPIIGFKLKNARDKKHTFLPVEPVESWGPGEIELDKKYIDVLGHDPHKNRKIIYLKESVLDKQIVDLTGMRIVRANDLRFNRINKIMCFVAIDISTRALLRRLGLYFKGLDEVFTPGFIEWKNVRLMHNQLQLSTSAKDMVKLHPADIANIVEKMNINQGSTFLQSLDESTAARVLEEIQPAAKRILVQNLGTERASKLASKMSADELADLIQILPDKASEKIIENLPEDSRTRKIKKILEYDEDTAGGLMTPEYISVTGNMKVSEVIEKIKNLSHMHHSIYFVYVLDEKNKFKGVVSLRKLIIANKDKRVHKIMTRRERRMPSTHVNHPLKEVATMMTKYNLLSVAVLDNGGKLLGVVTADDIMRKLIPEA